MREPSGQLSEASSDGGGRASAGQRLLWLMERYSGVSGMMNVPVIYRMRGRLEPTVLKEALTGVVARHEALRTSFRWRDRALRQTVHSAAETDLPVTDLSTADHPQDAALTAVRQRVATDVEVTRTPPLTADLYRIAEDDHVFLLNVHHLVTDAWSNMLLCRDLGALYNRGLGVPEPELPTVQWQYRDFTRWQEHRLRGPLLAEHEAYWSAATEGMRVPSLAPRPYRDRHIRPPAKNAWFSLTEEKTEALRQVARRHRTSLFVVLLSLFYAVLHAACGETDLSLGSVFANRERPELRDTVGFFANMVVLRNRLPGKPTLADVVGGTRTTVLGALAHQEFPYLTLPPGAGTSSAQGPQDVVFHMLAVPPRVATPGGIRFAGLEVESLRIPEGAGSRFDLELLVFPRTSGADLVFRYAADQYTEAYVAELVDSYRALAEALLTAPDTPIATLQA